MPVIASVMFQMKGPRPPATQNAQLSALLCRHLVPISITFLFENARRSAVVSAFVVELDDYAFLITAGHIVPKLWNLFEDERVEELSFGLLDANIPTATDNRIVPFDGDSIKRAYYFDVSGYDYGIIPLREHYYNLLVANGIVPLSRKFWEVEEPVVDDYVVVGVPEEWDVTKDPDRKIEFHFCLTFFKRLSEHPSGIETKPAGTIFGELKMDGSLDDFDGMSGGAVFGLKKGPSGGLKEYHLVGVQSSWVRNKYLIACPTTVLIERLWQDIQKQAAGT